MKPSSALIWLSILIAFLAVVAASFGLFWQNRGNSFDFTTLHGQTVKIFGQCLYAFDTVFNAGTYKGTDLIPLAFFVPLISSFPPHLL